MGYSNDEILKKNLGIMEDKVLEASRKYFAQEGYRIGGELLMNKYDKMIEINQQENQQKVQMAISAIRKSEAEGKKLSVTLLTKETGLSRGFFYKNEHVRNALEQALEKQNEKRVVDIRERVKKMSLEKQVAYYEKQLKEIISENERLKKENEKLRRKTIGKY